jgi:hypothetical protein
MDIQPDLEGVKITIEFDENNTFRIHAEPHDAKTLEWALEMALFAVKTRVDSQISLH